MVDEGRPPADPPNDLLAAVLAVIALQRGGKIVVTLEEISHVMGTVMGVRMNEELGLIEIYLRAGPERPIN